MDRGIGDLKVLSALPHTIRNSLEHFARIRCEIQWRHRFVCIVLRAHSINPGMEVADVMMIDEGEVIFFTQGDDYVDVPLADGVGGDASSSGIPAVVGAYKVFQDTL